MGRVEGSSVLRTENPESLKLQDEKKIFRRFVSVHKFFFEARVGPLRTGRAARKSLSLLGLRSQTCGEGVALPDEKLCTSCPAKWH